MNALDELEEIKELVNNDEHFKYKNIVNFNCESIEKSLKALEIIKEKRIDIESFYTSFIEGDYDYGFYERRYGTYGKYCLTEEEFDLLKEVLENE